MPIIKLHRITKKLNKVEDFETNQIEYMLCKTKAMLMMEFKNDFENMNEGFMKMDVNEETSKVEYLGTFKDNSLF